MIGEKGPPLPVPDESQHHGASRLPADDLPPSPGAPSFVLQVLVLLALLGPFIIFFLMPGGGLIAPKSAWVGLLLVLAGIGFMFLMMAKLGDIVVTPTTTFMLMKDEQPAVVNEVMDVRIATVSGQVQHFRGPLLTDPDTAFKRLKEELSSRTVPMLQQDDELGAHIILIPQTPHNFGRVKPWLHLVLLVVTFVTVTVAGATHLGVNPLAHPEQTFAGVPYAVSLLAVLGTHEMGHYTAARAHGMDVTPPFFFPAPFFLGTFGAFIQMRSPSETRTALFDTAVAGPLAGLLAAIVVLLVGLPLSTIHAVNFADFKGDMFSVPIGSSCLFAMCARLIFQEAAQPQYVMQLNPIAFAGWVGLIVTVFNLIPFGQLDGGHIVSAMFGNKAARITSLVALATVVLMALLVAPQLIIWAIVIVLLGGRSTPPLNDVSTLSTGRFLTGLATWILFAMIITPVPM